MRLGAVPAAYDPRWLHGRELLWDVRSGGCGLTRSGLACLSDGIVLLAWLLSLGRAGSFRQCLSVIPTEGCDEVEWEAVREQDDPLDANGTGLTRGSGTVEALECRLVDFGGDAKGSSRDWIEPLHATGVCDRAATQNHRLPFGGLPLPHRVSLMRTGKRPGHRTCEGFADPLVQPPRRAPQHSGVSFERCFELAEVIEGKTELMVPPLNRRTRWQPSEVVSPRRIAHASRKRRLCPR